MSTRTQIYDQHGNRLYDSNTDARTVDDVFDASAWKNIGVVDRWSTMSYDEQRALLGLPDVRLYVTAYQFRTAFTLLFERVAEAATALAEPFRQMTEPFRAQRNPPLKTASFRGRDGVSQVPLPSPSRTPPMWAIDASRARRPRRRRGQPNSQDIA